MSALSALRAALVADLPELQIEPSWPDVLTPPGGYITPALAADYVEAGPNFREHTVALDLVLYVDHGDPAIRLEELETMVEYAVLNTEKDWTLTGVDSPGPVQIAEDGADYLACVIHLTKPIRLGA